MTLSIVVLNYNTKALTISCLSALSNIYQKELSNGILEVIVVDNASPDGSAEEISSFLESKKGMSLVKNKRNVGFGAGNNVGVEKAKGEYIMLLNSDTEVLDKGFLEMVVFLKENKNIGILGPKIINFDGTPQPSAANFYTIWNLMLMLTGFEKRKSPNIIENVDWVTGAAMMFPKKIFNDIGMFDEKMFMYAEDMEICFRAKKLGFQTYFFPNARLKHKTAGSSNKTFAITNIYKSILYFYKKHRSSGEYVLVKGLLMSKAVTVYSLGKVLRNRYYVDTYRSAIKAVL